MPPSRTRTSDGAGSAPSRFLLSFLTQRALRPKAAPRARGRENRRAARAAYQLPAQVQGVGRYAVIGADAAKSCKAGIGWRLCAQGTSGHVHDGTFTIKKRSRKGFRSVSPPRNGSILVEVDLRRLQARHRHARQGDFIRGVERNHRVRANLSCMAQQRGPIGEIAGTECHLIGRGKAVDRVDPEGRLEHKGVRAARQG